MNNSETEKQKNAIKETCRVEKYISARVGGHMYHSLEATELIHPHQLKEFV